LDLDIPPRLRQGKVLPPENQDVAQCAHAHRSNVPKTKRKVKPWFACAVGTVPTTPFGGGCLLFFCSCKSLFSRCDSIRCAVDILLRGLSVVKEVRPSKMVNWPKISFSPQSPCPFWRDRRMATLNRHRLTPKNTLHGIRLGRALKWKPLAIDNRATTRKTVLTISRSDFRLARFLKSGRLVVSSFCWAARLG